MKLVTLEEVTSNPRKLYKKLRYRGINPIAKKEEYREVEYFRVKKRLTRKKKFLVNLYREADVKALSLGIEDYLND